jgi:hypothetical protein
MKPSRTVAPQPDEDNADLEALVLAELASLRPAPRVAVLERTARAAPRPKEAVSQRRERPRMAPLRRAPEPRPAIDAGERYDATAGDDGAEVSAEHGPDAADLASAEERAFIARAVAFLSGREHADIILGRVWEQLLELTPEGFYEPPADSTAADTAGASRAGASCADTKGSDTASPDAASPDAAGKGS